MLKEASIPNTLWFKASQAAVHVKNLSVNTFLKLEMTS